MTRFSTPEGVRFSCTRCGDCCRTWNVMLGPGERDRIEGLDWTGREPDLVGATTVVETEAPGSGDRIERLVRRDDGSCVFLGDDDRCRIHTHFGRDVKPVMCRMYPFGFSRLGDEVAVDCSFACRSVSHGTGEPVATHRDDWEALLTAGAETLEERTHRLAYGKPIGTEVLRELEDVLVGFLRLSELSLFDRIRCCLQYVRLVAAADPSAPSAPDLRRAMATGIPRQIGATASHGWMDRTQRAIFYQWLFLTLNPLPANLDLFPPGKRREPERRAAGEAFRRRQGRPRVDNRLLDVTFEDLLAVDTSGLAEGDQPLVRRWLEAKVIGQRFLVSGDEERPLSEAVPTFFLGYPMVLWTGTALAAHRGRLEVGDDEIRDAVRLVDRSAGQLPLSLMPKKLAKAWRFVMEETDVVVTARNEVLGIDREPPEGADEILPTGLR